MGSAEGADDERPLRSVQVDAFHISAHAITVEHYAAFVRDTGHPAPTLRELPLVVTAQHELPFRELAAPYVWRGGDPPRDRGRHPVTLVTHADAMAYCRWLSGQIGQLVRLPTEAEWERAARGGIEGRLYTWGDEPPQSQPRYFEMWKTGPERVGQRPANGFGLYDMSENVHEWCSDWYSADFYHRSPERNPRGPESGTRRSSRGGSWRHQVKITRVAARSSIPPEFQYSDYGLRCAMSL